MSGYGVFKIRGDAGRKKYKAHRVSLGVFSPFVYVLHRCDVRACVNPAHLYVGTHKQNMEDVAKRGRGRKKQETCNKGHPLSGDNLIGKRRICKICRKAYKLSKYGHVRR